MIGVTNEQLCCGCGVCVAVCPKDCITMTVGTLGAVFPAVDAEKCINCGKCDAVCPMGHADEMKNPSEEQAVYAAYAQNPQIRNSGSSGGMFGTIATHLLSRGYRVYGAAFDGEMKLRCVCADTKEELNPLCKSKYLQSDMSGAYERIRGDLREGKKVLFVSTPCQVAALKGYLQKNYDNLLTVDFLCHGVPSQQLFDQCKAYEEEKHSYKILSFAFRTKIHGGATPHYFTITTEKGGKKREITKPYFRSAFYAFFQKYISLRESCYDCIFAEQKRVSDLTIADFHDIEKYVPEINRFDGVSTVIVNTEQGKQLFTEIKSQLWTKVFTMSEMLEDKVLFAEKTKRPAGRDQFAKDYANMDFSAFVDCNLDKKRYALFAVYYKLPKAVRRLLKKLCHIE